MGPRLALGTATKLAAALVIGSIVAAGLDAYWLLLTPGRVLAGAIWQPVTFGFVESGPTSVVFGALILYSLGGTLETWWGGRRLAIFAVGVTVASGVATTLLALVFAPLRHLYFTGGSAMVSAVWCAYGWSLGRSRMLLYGISVTGNQLAAFGIGFTVLHAAFGPAHLVIPEAIAIALAYLHIRKQRRF